MYISKVHITIKMSNLQPTSRRCEDVIWSWVYYNYFLSKMAILLSVTSFFLPFLRTFRTIPFTFWLAR